MAKFTDAVGREWIVPVNVGAIKRVRLALGVDIADLTQNTLERLADDPCLLVDLLWVLLESQAKTLGVSDVQFGEGLVGDAIESGAAAVLEAVADFFPARKRSLLRSATAKMAALREKAETLAMERLNDPALAARLEAAMEAKLQADIEVLLMPLNLPTNLPDRPAA